MAKILINGGANINDGALVDIMEVEYKEMTIARAEKNYDNQTSVRELMDLMFSMGVDIDAYPKTAIPLPSTGFVGGEGTSGRTALYNATEGLHNDLMALLLENGANPNSVSKIGNTPLSAALYVMSGKRPDAGTYDDEGRSLENLMPTVQLLLDHGADIQTRVGTGGTVLHQAASYGSDEVVEFLIAQGIDLSVKDSSNRTALDVASGVAEIKEDEECIPGSVNCRSEVAPELPVYQSAIAILTEAMNAQGIAIEEYVVIAINSEDV